MWWLRRWEVCHTLFTLSIANGTFLLCPSMCYKWCRYLPTHDVKTIFILLETTAKVFRFKIRLVSKPESSMYFRLILLFIVNCDYFSCRQTFTALVAMIKLSAKRIFVIERNEVSIIIIFAFRSNFILMEKVFNKNTTRIWKISFSVGVSSSFIGSIQAIW